MADSGALHFDLDPTAVRLCNIKQVAIPNAPVGYRWARSVSLGRIHRGVVELHRPTPETHKILTMSSVGALDIGKKSWDLALGIVAPPDGDVWCQNLQNKLRVRQ